MKATYKQVSNREKSINQHDILNISPDEQGLERMYPLDPNKKMSAVHKQVTNKQLWITIIIGIIFHLVFSMSIFDVYIQSWKVMDVEPVQPLNKDPLSKRIILIQLDGGRSDTFFGYQDQEKEPAIGTPRSTYIHCLINDGKAAFGISHASVPTESRACLYTMMGGYYEDMTAILSGWADAGMQYDRIFNYVSAGWFFGPKMLHGIFESSKCPSCVRIDFYYDSHISYTNFDEMLKLDDFTIDRLLQMFNGQFDEEDQSKYEKVENDFNNLKKDGIIVYGNLIGTDAAGQGFKPNSWQYRENVRLDDGKIKKVIEAVEKYYKNDGQTTFIVTSDHGMADIGTHGDGNPQNTMTPFVIWGAGVAPAKNETDPQNPKTHDDYSKRWKLNQKQRFDIKQNQIPSLISSLIGIPIPINNEGIVPLEYLNATMEYRANALLQNAMQLARSYDRLEEQVKQSQKIFFTPYSYSSTKVGEELETIRKLIQKASQEQTGEISITDYEHIQNMTYKLIEEIEKGNQYLQLYLKSILQAVVGLGYLGFMAFCMISIFRFVNASLDESKQKEIDQNTEKVGCKYANLITAILSSIALVYLIVTEGRPIYYAYFFFPIYFFNRLLIQISYCGQGWNYSKFHMLSIFIAIFISGESLVYSFFNRQFISLNFIGLAIAAVFQSIIKLKKIPMVVLNWSIACIVIAIFPLLEPMTKSDDLIYSVGFILIVMVTFFLTFYVLYDQLQTSVKLLTWLIVYSGSVSLYVNYLMRSSQDIPDYILWIDWIALIISIGSIFVCDLHKESNYILRLYSFVIVLFNVILLLGISYDVVFFLAFVFILKFWIDYEHFLQNFRILKGEDQSIIMPHHFFVAFKLLLFTNISFFGTGNIVSISSFNQDSVNRFVINLHEFVITALIIVKLSVPFFISCAAFVSICKVTFSKIHSIGIFLLCLILVEIMTFNFFFMVRTQGTWQEKGSSVARFVISSVLILSQTILFVYSQFFFKKNSTGQIIK